MKKLTKNLKILTQIIDTRFVKNYLSKNINWQIVKFIDNLKVDKTSVKKKLIDKTCVNNLKNDKSVNKQTKLTSQFLPGQKHNKTKHM